MQNNRIDEDLDYNIYKYSYEYLLSILPEGLHSSDLKKYFNENNKLMVTTIDDTFKQIIFSSQNTGMLSNIINFNQRENVIKTILYDYKIDKIAELSTDKLFQEFVKVFNIKVKSKNLKQNSWYKWSNTIIDAANFLMQFENDFDKNGKTINNKNHKEPFINFMLHKI